jgi:hypothetical protein
VVYIAILVLLLVVIIDILLGMVRSQNIVKADKRIEESATIALERIVREIRSADAIGVSSVLGTSPGDLIITTSSGGVVIRTVEFYLSSGVIMMKENNVVSGPLTLSNASVSNLTFFSTTNAHSMGVKVDMTLQSGTTTSLKSSTFHTTAILRGSY